MQQSATSNVQNRAFLRQIHRKPENIGLSRGSAAVVHVWRVVAKGQKWFPKPPIPVQFRAGVPTQIENSHDAGRPHGRFAENRRLKEGLRMVPATGLEPVQCYLLEPESSASANSATRAT